MTPISYELADQLKDAGWLQPEFGSYVKGDWTFDQTLPIEFGADVNAYAPSLSELIAACPVFIEHSDFGQMNFVLKAHGQTAWEAGYMPAGYFIDGTGEGPTPEEATARLWLKLQSE